MVGEILKRGEGLMSGNHIPLFPLKQNSQDNKVLGNTFEDKTNSEVRTRQVRSDKCRDIKFPVSKYEQVRLKTACKQADLIYKKIHGYDQKLSQTSFNTLMLNYALKHMDSLKWERPYKDTKKYMHTKPTESEYLLIGGINGLSTKEGISDRKLVYCLVITILEILEREGEYGIVLL